MAEIYTITCNFTLYEDKSWKLQLYRRYYVKLKTGWKKNQISER